MDVVKAVGVADEAVKVAHSAAAAVSGEVGLRQYYALVELAIKTLTGVKRTHSLSIAEDVDVTLRLVELLVEETANIDMAENYLSSLKERLQNNVGLINEKLFVEYWLIYRIPKCRESRFHGRLAVNKCDELLQYLHGLEQDTAILTWIHLFQFINCSLNILIGKNKKAIQKFDQLLVDMEATVHPATDSLYHFVLLNYISFLLERRFNIPQRITEKLSSFTVHQIGHNLYIWKLLLELVQLIYDDANITAKLNEFKSFFNCYKDTLNAKDNYTFTLKINDKLSLNLKSPIIFQYQNIKNLLLFFQSISYLVNCYDERSNFSTKFLPKVIQTTESFINNNPNNESMESLNFWNLQNEFYVKLLELTHFYQICELQILNFNQIDDTFMLTSFPQYQDLVNVNISHKLQSNDDMLEPLQMYESIIQNKNYSLEIKLICLINTYVIRTSLVSQDIDRQDNMIKCGFIWSKIMKMYQTSTYVLNDDTTNFDNIKNTLWDCTICIIWIMSHLETFSWNPLPCTNDEKNLYLDKLKKYYYNNMVKTDETDVSELYDDKFKIKKSLMIRIILNYMGGKLFETNLNKICEISSICFQMCRKQNMDRIRYVIGLWHLMNCTIAMKPKDVAYTRAKLENIVKNILEQTGET